MSLLLNTACADDGNVGDDQTTTADANASSLETPVASNADHADDATDSILDQPVNFSTPEDAEKTIETVCKEAGEANCRKLKSALKYILAFDLNMKHDEAIMYQKLNGRTPNQIISKVKR